MYILVYLFVMYMPMCPQVLMGFDVDSCACGYDGQTPVLHISLTFFLSLSLSLCLSLSLSVSLSLSLCPPQLRK